MCLSSISAIAEANFSSYSLFSFWRRSDWNSSNLFANWSFSDSGEDMKDLGYGFMLNWEGVSTCCLYLSLLDWPYCWVCAQILFLFLLIWILIFLHILILEKTLKLIFLALFHLKIVQCRAKFIIISFTFNLTCSSRDFICWRRSSFSFSRLFWWIWFDWISLFRSAII